MVGACAIAVAAALFAASRDHALDRDALFEAVLALVPPSDVHTAVERARDLDPRERRLRAAKQLGADRARPPSRCPGGCPDESERACMLRRG